MNNCKNCQTSLELTSKYCPSCGGKVIDEPITVKKLQKELIKNVFGWDNKYLLTLKTLLFKPEQLFTEYLSGVRKRYMNPLAFLAISIAIGMLLFNQFADEFIRLNMEINSGQVDLWSDALVENVQSEATDSTSTKISPEAFKQQQLELQTTMQRGFLQYFNLLTFLVLPLYAGISYWTFGRKRHNYGEHIVLNAYLQGFTLLFTVLMFLGSILINYNIYSFSILVTMIYYIYSFKRFYQLSVTQTIWKTLRFIAIAFGAFLGFVLLGGITGLLLSALGIYTAGQ